MVTVVGVQTHVIKIRIPNAVFKEQIYSSTWKISEAQSPKHLFVLCGNQVSLM